MPIYEYACQSCDHTLDALQKMSEDPLVYCPSCGEPGLKKLMSAPRFRLKGEGWYETDFKKDKQRNVLKRDAETAESGKTEGAAGKDASSSDGAGGKADSGATKSSDKKPGGKVDSA